MNANNVPLGTKGQAMQTYLFVKNALSEIEEKQWKCIVSISLIYIDMYAPTCEGFLEANEKQVTEMNRNVELAFVHS